MLNGDQGNDVLIGGHYEGDDADTLNGGEGDDRLEGSVGADVLDGGNGFDTASFSSAVTLDLLNPSASTGEAAGDVYVSIERFSLSLGDDRFVGTDGGDVAHGSGGNDVLIGNGGDDDLNGGAGDDVVDGGAGNDTLRDASGNNFVKGRSQWSFWPSFFCGRASDIKRKTVGMRKNGRSFRRYAGRSPSRIGY